MSGKKFAVYFASSDGAIQRSQNPGAGGLFDTWFDANVVASENTRGAGMWCVYFAAHEDVFVRPAPEVIENIVEVELPEFIQIDGPALLEGSQYDTPVGGVELINGEEYHIHMQDVHGTVVYARVKKS